MRDPKNGTERIVVLGPTATPKALRMLRAHLKTLRGQPPHAPLFRSPRGTRVSYDALHYQWGQVCAASGLVDAQSKPCCTLHQLRHTRGSELVEHGSAGRSSSASWATVTRAQPRATRRCTMTRFAPHWSRKDATDARDPAHRLSPPA